ncbi:hypothetical protein ARMGADRAFT_1088427 [Armillaria gallica]|uniref:Uncharacterized protein n=1 Tax=Armillaria gallica TaxID=47427 RepID=A0A2H3CMT9_ARMGA|nr:hypothetical protein ARMGADRAFT_1088427 [Armillaria gallica]
MSTASSQSISSIAMVTKAVAQGASRLPATNPPGRDSITITVSFAISMLLITAMLVLKVQKLNATMRRREFGDAHEGLLEVNAAMYGDEKEIMLKGAVETALAEEVQVDNIAPVNDTMLIVEKTSAQSAEDENK